MEKSGSLYFGSIDGMRLLASAGIVLYHLEQIGGLYELRGQPEWLFIIIRGPAFHASLFFILGGFIYGTKYLDNPDRFSPKRFLVKRFRALYPLHAVTTLCMVILTALTTAAAGDGMKMAFSSLLHLTGLWAFFPFGSFPLNTPSWALSAFFLCYGLLGPMLRIVNNLNTYGSIAAGCAFALLPMTLWSGLYAFLGNWDLYQFFHIFPPLRLFEFLLGMIAAKLFLLARVSGIRIPNSGAVSDFAIIIICLGIYYNVCAIFPFRPAFRFFLYHVVMLPLYTAMLLCIAYGKGLIASLFALKPVRAAGVCSFYPYLLHIPFFSLAGFTAERFFGYDRLLHSPLNVAVLIAVLYSGCAVVWHMKKAGSEFNNTNGIKTHRLFFLN